MQNYALSGGLAILYLRHGVCTVADKAMQLPPVEAFRDEMPTRRGAVHPPVLARVLPNAKLPCHHAGQGFWIAALCMNSN
jgi:hypothetical protein